MKIALINNVQKTIVASVKTDASFSEQSEFILKTRPNVIIHNDTLGFVELPLSVRAFDGMVALLKVQTHANLYITHDHHDCVFIAMENSWDHMEPA